MTQTLLTARWVIGHDDGAHVIHENGCVLIEGDRIVHIGPVPNVDARHVDYGQAIISPGFVDLDALSDLDTTILGFDNFPAWRKGRVWPESYVARGPYEMYTPDELAFQKRFAFADLIRNGITTALPIASLFYREWGETVAEFDAAADAAFCMIASGSSKPSGLKTVTSMPRLAAICSVDAGTASGKAFG